MIGHRRPATKTELLCLEGRLRSVRPVDRELIARECDVVELPAGTRLLRAGRRPNHLVALLHGEVHPEAFASQLAIEGLESQATWTGAPVDVVAISSSVVLLVDRRRLRWFADLVPTSGRLPEPLVDVRLRVSPDPDGAKISISADA